MVTLSVHGSATRSVRPERAQLHLRVGLEGRDREVVVRRTAEVHARVTRQAADHQASGAASWWGSDRVMASSYKEYVKDSQTSVTRFRAAAAVQARFVDFEVLSRWVTDLAEQEGVTVAGIDWDLTQTTRRRLEQEARAAAVQDAVERAGDYATALGLDQPVLRAVWEAGLRPGPADGGQQPVAAMALRSAAGAESGGMSLAPGDIDVDGSVTADFDAAAP